MYKTIFLFLIFLSSYIYPKNNIGFSNFEIYKLKNNLNSFIIKDLDNDGFNDIIFIDNSEASISIFYQQNKKEIKKSKKEFYLNADKIDVNKLTFNLKYKNIPFVAEKTISSLAISDVGGNKLNDLIYLTSRGELIIKYQTKKRTFVDGQSFIIPDYLNSEDSLVSKDINNDNKDDLILLGKKYLYIFYQNSKHKLDMPIKYSYSSKSPLGIEVSDLNGDGLNDILFVTSGGINQVRVRFQLKDNTIGPDNIIDYPNFHFLTTKNILKNKKAQFLSSRARAHIIFVDEISKIKDKEMARPSIYSLAPEAISNNKNIIFNDFDGDNKKDLIVSDPNLAYLMVFKSGISGFKNYKTYPIIKNISKLLYYNISKTNKILAFSKQENSLLSYDSSKKVPDFIINDNKIEGISKYKNYIYWIVNKSGENYLEKIKISKKFKVSVLFSRKIINSINNFDNFFISDINNDKKEDIIYTIPYEGAKIFISSGYQIKELDIKIKNISSFLSSITKNQIKVMDINNDNKNEVIVTNKGIIRAFVFNKEKGLEILKQINGETINSDLTLPVKSSIFNKYGNLIFFDKSNSTLNLMDNNALNIQKKISIKGIEVMNIISKNINNSKAKELIIIGRNSIAIYDNRNLGYKLNNIITYRLHKNKSISTMLAVGNFNNKKLISIDGIEHSINFLKISANKLKSVLKFKIFDAISYRGRNNVRIEEPKNIIIRDMNNDKKDDVILYVHDKLIIYYQE